MFKVVSSFLGCCLVTVSCFAGPTTLDCQTSTTFEQNLGELETIVTAAADNCPKPTREDFNVICNSISKKKGPSEGSTFGSKYQEDLWKMSCANPLEDSPDVANQKIRNMWNKSKEEFNCKSFSGVTVPDGNILKFSMEMNFSTFLVHAVKKYKLDMNFKDPVDGKTIMDFLTDQIQSYSRAGYTTKVEEYDRIYKLLEKNGAKHAKDL